MLYPFDNNNRIPALIICCSDWKTIQQTLRFAREELRIPFFTLFSFPAGPRVLLDIETRNVFLSTLERTLDGEHGAQQIILVAHRDCTAYDDSVRSERERGVYERDLRLAREVILRKFPNADVSLYYMEIVKITGGEGKLEPQRVGER